MIDKRKAKKEYKCDLTNKIICIDELYKRVNIRGIGIFHFKKECSDYAIKHYINEYYCLEKYSTHLCNYGEDGIEY